jgi:hypothetical protein
VREKQVRSHVTVADNLYIVGANASNSQHVRKVVWAGKLREVMTFAEAFKRLKGERFANMRGHQLSPLHVRPVEKDRKLIGYEHRSQEHIDENDWISDLITDKDSVRVDGRTITIVHGTAWLRFWLRSFSRIRFLQGPKKVNSSSTSHGTTHLTWSGSLLAPTVYNHTLVMFVTPSRCALTLIFRLWPDPLQRGKTAGKPVSDWISHENRVFS